MSYASSVKRVALNKRKVLQSSLKLSKYIVVFLISQFQNFEENRSYTNSMMLDVESFYLIIP